MTDLFPIERDIVYNHVHYKKRLEKDEKVRCRFCNFVFALNNMTVHMAPDEMQIVTCPHCKRQVSILYFFDNTLKDERTWTPKRLTDDDYVKRMYVRSDLY